MADNNFKGTLNLLRFYLRRDRFILPVWILLPLFLIAGQISFIGSMADWREFMAELSANALTNAILGPIVPLSKEGAVLWRGMLQSSIAVMIGSSFTAIRHTRSDEESGRYELIYGNGKGRYAAITAAIAISFAGSFISALFVSIIMIISGFSLTGSLLAGLTLCAVGLIFTGIGVLISQIFQDSGSARGFILALYFLSMVPMMINNVGGGSTFWIWLAPEAWFRITEPFGGNNFSPLLVFMVLSIIPIAFAYYLMDNRDLGRGIFKEKLGPEDSAELKSPLALSLRQHKKTIIVWCIGMAFIGGAVGFITPSISENISEMLVNMSTWAKTMSKLGNREGFVSVTIYIMGLMAGTSVYGISTVLNLKKEESEHFAEMLLAQPVSRIKLMSGYLIIAYAGSAVILLVLGASVGWGWGYSSGDMSLVSKAIVMSLTKIPSVWVIIGITSLLYGWMPRISAVLSWVLLGLFIVTEMLWEAGIVGWSAMELTPFGYAHYSIPVNELSALSLSLLVLLSITFTLVGLAGFKNRNII